MPKKKTPKLTDKQRTRQIIEFLKIRHPSPEWANFVEFRAGTGYESKGQFDFMTFHTWPSKGFRRIIYEIKVSRGDFTKELNNLEKRLPAEQLAHECWFATPAGLVKPDEVPEGWGLVEQIKNGMRAKKQAKQRNPGDLSEKFYMMLARRSAEPKPELHPMAWYMAGQELSEQDLIKMIGESRNSMYMELEYKIREQFENSQNYKELEQIKRVVTRHLGYRFGDPGILDAWFVEGKLERKIKQPSHADRLFFLRLRSFRDEITELLEEASG
jgi:hypothetical protein